MSLCSNCQTSIVENGPYREATIEVKPLEPKRSLMSRVNISPRAKRITLWSVGVFAGVGIPAYLFQGIALTVLLGLAGVVGVAIAAVIAWCIIWWVPQTVGRMWVADWLGEGTTHHIGVDYWWMSIGVFVCTPGVIALVVWGLYAIGKFVAAMIHIGA